MKLVAATENSHKLREFREILEPLGIQVLSTADAGCRLTAEETGSTFRENAEIKARAVFEATGLPAFADDSGLCVDALDGRPGIYSARYGGEGLTNLEQIALLLEELREITGEKRTARFVSAISCVLDRETTISCQGVCEGVIAMEPRTDNGFGYDPVFLVGDRSFSELTADEKNAISHRGAALREFAALLRERLEK